MCHYKMIKSFHLSYHQGPCIKKQTALSKAVMFPGNLFSNKIIVLGVGIEVRVNCGSIFNYIYTSVYQVLVIFILL